MGKQHLLAVKLPLYRKWELVNLRGWQVSKDEIEVFGDDHPASSGTVDSEMDKDHSRPPAKSFLRPQFGPQLLPPCFEFAQSWFVNWALGKELGWMLLPAEACCVSAQIAA